MLVGRLQAVRDCVAGASPRLLLPPLPLRLTPPLRCAAAAASSGPILCVLLCVLLCVAAGRHAHSWKRRACCICMRVGIAVALPRIDDGKVVDQRGSCCN
jgi:hypothetical protein